MRRPALAILLVLALAAVAVAQQPGKPPLVGFLPLGSASDAYDRSLVEAFRQGLRQTGVVEGRDVVLDVVWTNEDQLGQAVLALKQRGAKVLIPVGTSASMAVKRHASAVPILFISVGNPLGIGLVDSLSRPNGLVTGFADGLAELGGKHVQFATEIVKPPAPIHYLWHSGWTDGQYRLQVSERAARELGVKLRPRAIMDMTEADAALAEMKHAGASLVIVQPSPFTFLHRVRLVELATNHRLATIFAFRPAAKAGAVITYGTDYGELYRRAASYLERILKGTRPGDLPVEQPTKYELLINLKAARAAGMVIPPSVLARADEVLD